MSARLVPVGHHHGVIHGEQPYLTVRLGPNNVYLDDAEYGVWLLAHGGTDGPLTAAELAEPTGRAVVDQLLAKGLLTRLPDDPRQQSEFASAFRLVPLVFGLGNAPSGPGWRFWVGLPGEKMGRFSDLSGAWAEVTVLGYEIWRWSAATRSLDEACRRFVTTAQPASGTSPRLQLDAVDHATALDHGVQLVGPLVTGWAAALQPAAEGIVVPAGGAVLPPVDPAERTFALDPEEVLELPLRPGGPASAVIRLPRWEADPGHAGAAGWLFAAGHDGGPLYHPADGEFVGRVIRVGATDHLLTATEARLWEATRTADGQRLWTRTAVAAVGVGEGIPDGARAVDALVERGLLVEVHPGTEQAVAFARAYRLQPLMHGLGNTTDSLGMFYFGVPGRRSVTSLTMADSPLWRMAGQWPTLWEMIVALTAHLAGLGRTDPREIDPREFLTGRAFHGLRDLLEAGIAYLDLAP